MRRTTRAALLLGSACLFLGLIGCGRQIVKEPQVQYITVEKYVPLPDNALQVPSILYPKDRSAGEVLRAYNFNTPQLEQCIINIRGIQDLQPQK